MPMEVMPLNISLALALKSIDLVNKHDVLCLNHLMFKN